MSTQAVEQDHALTQSNPGISWANMLSTRSGAAALGRVFGGSACVKSISVKIVANTETGGRNAMMVKELLTEKNSKVVTVSPTTTLAEAARTMVDHRIGALVVIDGAERLLGIVSERDLTKAIVDHVAGVVDKRVVDVMTHPVVTVDPDESVIEALYLMNSKHIRHIAILDRNMLAGMISIRDVTGKWIELLEKENSQLRGSSTQGALQA